MGESVLRGESRASARGALAPISKTRVAHSFSRAGERPCANVVMAREPIAASGGTYFRRAGRDTKAGQVPQKKFLLVSVALLVGLRAKSFS